VLTLVIGNKNYSSWSLRAWLALRQAQIDFEEIRIPLYGPGSKQEVLRYSPSGKVPVLIDGDATIWESLAICEYVAERYPDRRLWPQATNTRALARAMSCEMHAGFVSLRTHMSMNCRKRLPGKGRAPGVQDDIDRVCAIWKECRTTFGVGGPFLFGAFSIADAMFAPVALRLDTYAVPLDALSRDYADAVLALPALQAWINDARAETEVLEKFER
jgi:glutathione S-transferase